MKIVIVGAGGQGAIAAEALLVARDSGLSVEPIGFVADDGGPDVLGLPILGPVRALAEIAHDAILVAVGDNGARRALFEELDVRGEAFAIARHPWSSISAFSSFGAGSMISAGAVVAPRATIGRGVILNTNSSVDHDTAVGDFAHVSAGATVGGRCVIGDETMIGLGASVLSGCRVGARSVIGAGAVVVRDIPDDVVAYGNPARVRRTLR